MPGNWALFSNNCPQSKHLGQILDNNAKLPDVYSLNSFIIDNVYSQLQFTVMDNWSNPGIAKRID